jgi:hypothetical protein
LRRAIGAAEFPATIAIDCGKFLKLRPLDRLFQAIFACKCCSIPGDAASRAKNHDKRLTGLNPGIYCAPFQVKGVFLDAPAVDGVQKRAILGSSPQALVASGHSLKIRIGNLCGDSRHYTFGAIDDEFPKRPAVHWCSNALVNGCEFWISIASVT